MSDVVSDSFSSFVEKLFPSPERETEPQAVSHIGDSLPKYKPIVIEKSLYSDDQAVLIESTMKNMLISAPKPQRKVKGKFAVQSDSSYTFGPFHRFLNHRDQFFFFTSS